MVCPPVWLHHVKAFRKSLIFVTQLYLIRHGEAVSNVEPVIAGMQGDAGLTPLGVAQAERLRDRLAASGEVAADVLIASTLPRARQTAKIIAPALGLPIIWDDEVQELRPGEADGLSLAEYRERYGSPEYESDPFQPLAPAGESWASFLVRAAAALLRIARDYQDKRIVVVCHGGVIDASFQTFAEMNLLAPKRLDFDTRNTSITHWSRHQHGDLPPRWRLMRYNDAAHLDLEVWPARRAEQPSEMTHSSVPLPSEE